MTDDTTIQHHLDVASLMSCSAGSQPEALAAILALHLSICPQCSRKLSELSRVGEALFDALPAAPLSKAAPLLKAATSFAATKPETATSSASARETLAQHLHDAEWQLVGHGARAASFQLSPRATGDLCVIDLAPGATLPDRARDTANLLFVIEGSYRDDRGTFGPGDVADFDAKSASAPVADAVMGCRCLVASDTSVIYRSAKSSQTTA